MIIGGPGNDGIILGASGDNDPDEAAYGEDGDDGIGMGSGPNSVASGGNGRDTIRGAITSQCCERIYGGYGSDYIQGWNGGEYINGGPDIDTLYGCAAVDGRDGGGAAFCGDATVEQETIVGSSGSDFIFGQVGNDQIYAGPGNDEGWGGIGSDTIAGGTGYDKLVGGTGNDVLTGNLGADTFYCGPGTDRITDFSRAAGDRKSTDCERF
jgi:Ca2+-binding RTX toxin-like protein